MAEVTSHPIMKAYTKQAVQRKLAFTKFAQS
jgi:hypothetical protein